MRRGGRTENPMHHPMYSPQPFSQHHHPQQQQQQMTMNPLTMNPQINMNPQLNIPQQLPQNCNTNMNPQLNMNSNMNMNTLPQTNNLQNSNNLQNPIPHSNNNLQAAPATATPFPLQPNQLNILASNISTQQQVVLQQLGAVVTSIQNPVALLQISAFLQYMQSFAQMPSPQHQSFSQLTSQGQTGFAQMPSQNGFPQMQMQNHVNGFAQMASQGFQSGQGNFQGVENGMPFYGLQGNVQSSNPQLMMPHSASLVNANFPGNKALLPQNFASNGAIESNGSGGDSQQNSGQQHQSQFNNLASPSKGRPNEQSHGMNGSMSPAVDAKNKLGQESRPGYDKKRKNELNGTSQLSPKAKKFNNGPSRFQKHNESLGDTREGTAKIIETAEDRQWREDRKRNFPTGKNIQKKAEDLQQKTARDEDEDAKKRKKLLREILAKQAELGCEVAEIPREYLDDKDGHKTEVKVGNDDTEQNGRKKYQKGHCFLFQKGRCKKERHCRYLHVKESTDDDNQNQDLTIPKRKPSLLEKLLSKDIKKEKSQLLQVFRFIVNNNFFDEWPNKPLEYFRWSKEEPIETVEDVQRKILLQLMNQEQTDSDSDCGREEKNLSHSRFTDDSTKKTENVETHDSPTKESISAGSSSSLEDIEEGEILDQLSVSD